MSARRRRATGWLGSQGFFFTLLLIAPLMYLSGCGSGQTDVGQTNNSVPVSLSISMPQKTAATASYSTIGSHFWATVQSWLPSLTSAWAAGTTADLRTLTVEVTGPGIPSPITSLPVKLTAPAPNQVITVNLEVPVGPDRMFSVSGLDATKRRIFRGQRIAW